MFCQFVPTEPKRKRSGESGGESKTPVKIGAPDIHKLKCNQCLTSSNVGTQLDTITFDELESKYVEWVSPDQTLKCCYNASTLSRIRSQQGHMMQPPHFRIPMSGIDAQKISEAFNIPLVTQPVDHIPDTTVQTNVNNNRVLLDWAGATMGTARDLFICPVCWTQLTCRTLTNFRTSHRGTHPNKSHARVLYTYYYALYGWGRWVCGARFLLSS